MTTGVHTSVSASILTRREFPAVQFFHERPGVGPLEFVYLPFDSFRGAGYHVVLVDLVTSPHSVTQDDEFPERVHQAPLPFAVASASSRIRSDASWALRASAANSARFASISAFTRASRIAGGYTPKSGDSLEASIFPWFAASWSASGITAVISPMYGPASVR